MAIAQIGAKVVKAISNIFLGIIALAFSSIVNSLLGVILLARFVVMIVLRSLSTTVEFVGETTINILSFVRDTVFAILTFVVQTVTNIILFNLNLLVSVWTLVIELITNALGETCYLAKKGSYRIIDAVKDFAASLSTFVSGVPGLMKVVKAQGMDIQSGVDVKGILKQSLVSLKESLVYIFKGDEGTFKDGIIPNVLIEVSKALPLTVDLAKLILMGTWDISKQTLSGAFSSAKKLLTMTDIFKICSGKV